MAQQMQMTEEQQKALQEKLKKMSPEELKEFQKQQCIFCQIINGKVPSKKVYEDEKSIAILDINPAAQGHILLLPKEHYAIMPQVPDAEIGHLFSISKKLSQAILRGLKVSGTNIFIANGFAAGQKAQHFIMHIIPRKEGDNVLNLQERAIDEKAIEGAKLMIGKKLTLLVGTSKPIKEEKIPPMQENLEQKKKELKEKEEDILEKKKESKKEKIRETKPAKVKQNKNLPAQKAPTLPAEIEKKIPAKKRNTGSDISIDDIAKLFK